jgi:glycosyltransferase involved in cell wall biosynthesis
MNYAFFTPVPGFGGLEIQTILRAKDAIMSGNESVVLATPDTKSFNYSNELGIETIPFRLRFKYFDIFSAYKLSKYFKKHKIDICIVPKTELLSIALAARSLSVRDIKVVLYQQMQSGIVKKDPIHNWIYRNLDAAIVLTKAMKKQLADTTNFPSDKIFVVPYGIKLGEYSNTGTQEGCRKEFELPQDAFIVGCVGRIEPHKDQMTALEAFNEAAISESILVFCGNIDNQEYYKSLTDKIRDYRLEVRVRFIPFTQEIPKLMKCFDVFILPSPAETFGLVYIEAMAASVPAMGVDGGGVPEIINDGENGFLFKSHDHQYIASIFRRIRDNKELASSISINACNTVQERFNYDIQSEKFFSVIESLVSSKDGSQ